MSVKKSKKNNANKLCKHLSHSSERIRNTNDENRFSGLADSRFLFFMHNWRVHVICFVVGRCVVADQVARGGGRGEGGGAEEAGGCGGGEGAGRARRRAAARGEWGRVQGGGADGRVKKGKRIPEL